MSSFNFIMYKDNDCPLFFLCFSESVKQEPMDDDFREKKKGLKRKRIKDEPMEGPSHSTATPS